MKNLKRITCLIMVLLLSFTTLVACNNGPSRDNDKSLLNIGVIDDGFGTEWIDETVSDFCKYYENYQFDNIYIF